MQTINKTNIQFNNGYMGAYPQCKIRIDDIDYILEITELETYILNKIDSNGYTTTKEKAQKLPRIHLNN